MDKRLTWRDIKELCKRILKGRMYTIIDPSLELDPIDSIWIKSEWIGDVHHENCGVYIKFIPGVVLGKSGTEYLTYSGIIIEENNVFGVIESGARTKISSVIDCIIDVRLLGIISRMYYTLYPLYPEPKTTHIEIDEEEYANHHDGKKNAQKKIEIPGCKIRGDMFSEEELQDIVALHSTRTLNSTTEKHKIDIDNSRAKITTTRQILADDKISLLSTVIMETCITLIQENTRAGYNTYAKTVKDTRERLNTILHEVFQEEVTAKKEDL